MGGNAVAFLPYIHNSRDNSELVHLTTKDKARKFSHRMSNSNK